MRPVKDWRTPKELSPPAGMSNYDPLPVFIDAHEGFFISYWSLTWKERLQVLFGRNIRLYVASRVHPPLHLDTEPV